jgi:hypothetical protein
MESGKPLTYDSRRMAERLVTCETVSGTKNTGEFQKGGKTRHWWIVAS